MSFTHPEVSMSLQSSLVMEVHCYLTNTILLLSRLPNGNILKSTVSIAYASNPLLNQEHWNCLCVGTLLFVPVEVNSDLGGVNPDNLQEMSAKSKVVGSLSVGTSTKALERQTNQAYKHVLAKMHQIRNCSYSFTITKSIGYQFQSWSDSDLAAKSRVREQQLNWLSIYFLK